MKNGKFIDKIVKPTDKLDVEKMFQTSYRKTNSNKISDIVYVMCNSCGVYKVFLTKISVSHV